VLTHPRLSKTEPADLRMPAADAAIVDESAIGALVTSVVVDPALLTDLATYDSAPGEEHRIEEAEAIGRAVAEAVAGSTDAVAALRAAGVAPQHLREAAAAASLGADKARPAVHPGMPDMLARGVLARHRGHPGRGVAAVFTQLARDLEAGRSSSSGIEWDAKNTAKLDDGTKVPHPVIRRHGLAAVKGVPSTAPLLLLDADAELDINRRMFGDDGLRGFTVPAVRQAYVIQVSDAAVAKSSLAPGVRLRNNKAKAEKLRGRITELVQRETADGPRVLVIAPLQVRRALTGEMGDAVPVWTPWHGAELTHYGRHLGVNRWAEFDTVIIIGREELPPVVAERIARAIWADTPDVALNLPGEFGRELRRHDLRTGTAPAVSVRAHADPRVQSVIEISRECAMGQGADRLRLIHRDPAKPARVIVMSNLPVPGLVVDELLTLDDVLAGGTVWQRARAAVPAGVLPLSPDWLTANLSGLFPSRRTAARAVGELVPTGNIYPYCQVALIRTAGPGRPGKALVAAGVADPRGELARLLGCEVVGFRLPTQADEKPTAAKPEGAPKTEPVSVSPAKPAPAVEPEDDMPPDQLPAVATFATLRADTLPPFETVLPPATPAAPMLVPAPGARDRLGVLSARLEAARPLWCGCGCRSFWKPAGGPWTCASCYPAEDEVAAWTWVPSDVAVARAAARRTVGLAAYAARALEHGGGAARLCAAGV